MPQPYKDVGEDVNALQGIMSDHKSKITANAKLAAEFLKLKEYLTRRSHYTLSDRLQLYKNLLSKAELLSSEQQRIIDATPMIPRLEPQETLYLEENHTLRGTLERFRKACLH